MRTNFRTKPVLAVAATAVLTVGLSACGADSKQADEFSGKKPEEVLEAAKKASLDAKNVQVESKVDSPMNQSEQDLTLTSEGECTGEVKSKDMEIEVLRVGGKNYIKPDKEFWQGYAQGDKKLAKTVTDKVGDKWATSSNPNLDLAKMCSLEGILGGLDLSKLKDPKVSDPKDVDGDKVVELTGDDASGSGTVTLTVAANEPNYLLGMKISPSDETKDSPQSMSADFSFDDYDSGDVEIKAPSDSDVVNLDKLPQPKAAQQPGQPAPQGQPKAKQGN